MAYKPFDLTGKVALVTGGNGGIGLGMADALAQAGADVVIWGTNEGKNAAAEEQLKAHGRRVLTQKINVADEQEVISGMAEAINQMGRLDTVIANAGVGGGARSFSEMTTETYRRVLSVNLDGVFFTFREAAPRPATPAARWWSPRPPRPSMVRRGTKPMVRRRRRCCRWSAPSPSSTPATACGPTPSCRAGSPPT